MIKQYSRLLWWGLIANPLRTVFLLLTIIGSMTAFSSTEATLRDLANRSNDLWRIYPYDLQVTGENVFSSEAVIRSLPGVRVTEGIYMCNVMLRSTSGKVVVLTRDKSLLPITYSQGRAPALEDEIAISGHMSAVNKITLGDTVEVVYVATRADLREGKVDAGDVASFTVCGITENMIEQTNCLTEAGLHRIHPSPAKATALLIVGDGTVVPIDIGTAIKKLDKELSITLPQQEVNNNVILSMAMGITRLVSLIMLAASVGGFYMLLTLSQKERLYELGVLRAVGLSADQLTALLLLEGGSLIVVGGALGVGILYTIVTVVNTGNFQSLLQQNLLPMLTLLGSLMAIVLYTSKAIQDYSVINMMRDER